MESLQAVTSELSYQGEKLGIDPLHHSEMLHELKIELEPLISLTLYVCTQLSEIPEFDKRSPVNYNPRQNRIYPPEKPLIWDVAFRSSAAIRKADSEKEIANRDVEQRHRPRPYIRRAHWHGFWKGSKQSRQKIELKWLPPIAVNVSPDNLIITKGREIK